MHPATKAAKSDPNSNLRQWFPFAIADFLWFTEFFVSINPGDLTGFWGRRKSHFLTWKISAAASCFLISILIKLLVWYDRCSISANSLWELLGLSISYGS